MIELKGVSKTYFSKNNKVVALENININIAKGEIFGVIGKSGAGKSTLIRCVNLLERPTSGQVFVDNKELTAMSKTELRLARRDIGMIFQHFNLLAARTVFENVALPLQFIGANKNKINSEVNSLLELVGLTDKKNNYPAQLSGGQKQRVAIARALAYHPKVLLCDEATSALDPQTTSSILTLLKDINKRLNISIMLITHEMGVIKTICDRVAVLENGHLTEQAKVIEIFTNPKSDTVKEFTKTCLRRDLPEKLQQHLSPTATASSHPVLRILFIGTSVSKPIIAHLINEIGIELNILQANIEYIKNDSIGIMVFEITANQEKLPEVIKYLEQTNSQVEVIGYVPSHASSDL